ncbi:MAG TPA: hypothetical protein VGG95_03170 [Edaphobacter sp.]|jgi:hypothetical protein
MSKEEVLKIMHGHSAAIPSATLAGFDRTSPVETRITELEVENIRLQRLVAELLLKNQQLRKSGN